MQKSKLISGTNDWIYESLPSVFGISKSNNKFHTLEQKRPSAWYTGTLLPVYGSVDVTEQEQDCE